MAEQSFATQLRNLLIKSGHMEGRDKWADSHIGSRTLSRWLNGHALPSEGIWIKFVEVMSKAHRNDRFVMDDLRKVEQAWTKRRRGSIISRRSGNLPTTLQSDKSQVPITTAQSTSEEANELYARFIADTRIAAQLTAGSGTHSVYLDDVYVHRKKVEELALDAAGRYVTASGASQGRWLSIGGDAGHGKTSLLWCLVHEFRQLWPSVFPVQALQLSKNALADFVRSLPVDGSPYIVVLDTLDLLTGVDNTELGAQLNEVRAKGALLVTTCRRQELQLLARHIRSDQTIDLGRYEPEEARLAIEHYVRTSYRTWPKEKRQAQVEHIWELLDERRRIQDLNFEPLLLRMIFEAYVPDDIPSDINTQRVYDHFWQERVLGDRRAQTPEAARARDAVCRLLASFLYFNTAVHTERISVDVFLRHCESQGVLNPLATIEGLASSGVVRYWQMRSSCGFFHQTFLEYAAARDLLALEDRDLQRLRIDNLLADAEDANLFRIPVLKQLMIQSSGSAPSLFDHLCEAVVEIGSPIVARLALEVLGKAQGISRLHRTVLAWGTRQPELFQAVALEVLRHYPATRVDIAFDLLARHINEKMVGEVCYVCSTFFAPMEPEKTLTFLLQLWRSKPSLSTQHQADLKAALVAVFRAGASSALEALSEILPTLSVGVQAGALDDLSRAWTAETSQVAAEFLGKMFDFLSISDSNEPRAAYVQAFRLLHDLDPSRTTSLITLLGSRYSDLSKLRVATLMARLIGIADPSSSVINAAMRELLGPDHVRRLYASDLLREAARTKSSVVDKLLTLPHHKNLPAEGLNAIYFVASGSGDPARMLRILDRWKPMERGAGSAFRILMKTIVKADPPRILAWLQAQIPKARSVGRQRQILVGFQILAENAASSMSSDDVRQFFEWGFRRADATDEMKRVFACVAGWVTEIDVELAREVLRSIYATRRRSFVNAAINSLRAVRSIEFLEFAFDLTLAFTRQQQHNAAFGHFLEVIADRSTEIRVALLQRLATPEAKALIRALDSPVVVSHLLTLLKSTAKADVVTVLELVDICPVLDDGNAATLSAVLENAIQRTTDPDLARSLLSRLLKLCAIPSYRVRNSLHRALPQIDKLLPHREAVEFVKAKIQTSSDLSEKSLEQLIRALKHMESWERTDAEELLRSDLPHSVKALLLT